MGNIGVYELAILGLIGLVPIGVAVLVIVLVVRGKKTP